MRFLAGFVLLSSLTFGQCLNEFCQYKNQFQLENKTAVKKATPLPVFKIPNTEANWMKVPPPPRGEQTKVLKKEVGTEISKTDANLKTEESVIPINNFEIVKTPSAAVEVSLTDLNRIVCPADLRSFAYSKEKQIKVEKSGNDLYVKFLPIEIWNPKKGQKELVYKDFPRDLFVNCGGQTYSLILLPKKDFPARVIYLQSPHSGNKKEAEKFETSLPYEETLMSLIRYAYKDKIPPGYSAKLLAKPYKEFKELSLVLNKEYIGNRFKILEFVLTAKQDIRLYEAMFVPYIPKAVAIAIEKPILKRGEMTRLFAVVKND